MTLTLEEKLARHKQMKALEVQRHEKRRSLFDAQNDIERRRDQFTTEIEETETRGIARAAVLDPVESSVKAARQRKIEALCRKIL